MKSNRQYAEILLNLINGLKGKDLSLALDNFVEFLHKERKLKKADKIIEEFIKLYKREEGIEEMTIITARNISDKLLSEIKKIFGGKVEFKLEVKEDLLGGVIIKTEDKILDGSIRTQIKQLKTKLVV